MIAVLNDFKEIKRNMVTKNDFKKIFKAALEKQTNKIVKAAVARIETQTNTSVGDYECRWNIADADHERPQKDCR
jgi:hypothetical protein